MCTGRWNDVRKPTTKELNATMVIEFPIDEASAKIRSGPPVDDEKDYTLNTWAGILPIVSERKTPIPDPKLKVDVIVPKYLFELKK
jgi:uncharacterized protein